MGRIAWSISFCNLFKYWKVASRLFGLRRRGLRREQDHKKKKKTFSVVSQWTVLSSPLQELVGRKREAVLSCA